MPAAVGAGTFWKGMVDWINGKDTKSDARLHRELLAEVTSRLVRPGAAAAVRALGPAP